MRINQTTLCPSQRGKAGQQSKLLSAARTIQACKLKRTSKLEKKGKRKKGERATKGQCRLRQSPVGSFLKDQQGYRQRQQQRRWRQRVANEIKGEQTSYGQTISNGPKRTLDKDNGQGTTGKCDKGRGTTDNAHCSPGRCLKQFHLDTPIPNASPPHPFSVSLCAQCKICLWEQRLICAATVPTACLSLYLSFSFSLCFAFCWPACPLIKLNFMGHMYTLNEIG